jgi:hypothetical protein
MPSIIAERKAQLHAVGTEWLKKEKTGGQPVFNVFLISRK